MREADQDPGYFRVRLLHCIADVLGVASGVVADSVIAARLGAEVNDVRGHLEILEEQGKLSLDICSTGYYVYMSPGQRQSAKEAEMATPESDSPTPDPRNVFVVYGRNVQARDAVFAFLQAIDLHPLDWAEVVQATGKASPYIGEVLEKGFSMARAVVVLLTPDDEARLRETYRGPNDPPFESQLTPQPRQNVLIEAGMALGLHPDRTVLVEFPPIRGASDLHGRYFVRMSDTPEMRHELAQHLRNAGCAVNTKGPKWLRAGDFASAVKMPAEADDRAGGDPKGVDVFSQEPDEFKRALLMQLGEIEENGGLGNTAEGLASSLRWKLLVTRHHLDVLKKWGYIGADDGPDGPIIQLTNRGRSYLVETGGT